MKHLGLALACFGLLCTCGGSSSISKDWSGAPLPEQALDYCIKLSACTGGTEEGTIAECVTQMTDLSAFSGTVPTRRAMSDLVTLRECYNKAKWCSGVRRCAGVPEDAELPECNVDTSANVCEERMGLSLLRTCLPDPDGEGGVRVEIDCTRFGRICGFDEDGDPRCVGETCIPNEYEPTCDEQTGTIAVCGGVDPVTGMPVGQLVNEYECGALGLGCAFFEGDPKDPADDGYNCVATGEDCDPFAEAPTCDGSVLSLCLQNPDGTGSRASWDCASGAINKTCTVDPQPLCAPTNIICDPAVHPGTCDGTTLTVCVDGDLVETDCREHGASDCQPDAEGKGRCIE